MNLRNYQTFVFDCDGVILDSNKIKSDAFYEIGLPHGRDVADELVAFHKARGGMSRHKKIAYLYHELLGLRNCEAQIENDIKKYGDLVTERLLACPVVPGFEDFMADLPGRSYKLVVSGGAQSELRQVFAQRGLANHFDGIWGSPATKEEILAQQLTPQTRFVFPAVFFGDSRLDFEAARTFCLDFVFVSGHTEFSNWEGFCADKGIPALANWSEVAHSLVSSPTED